MRSALQLLRPPSYHLPALPTAVQQRILHMSASSPVKAAAMPDIVADAPQTDAAEPNTTTTKDSAADKPPPKKRQRKNAKHPEYDKRRGTRPESTTTPSAEETTLTPEEIEARKARRLGPKSKVALLLSYCGTGYQGMQTNPGAKTIEAELLKALVAATCVSEDNADIKKIGFQRAARTDKGVHAGGQVVNAKLVLSHLEDPVATINSHLPEQIRVWGSVKVLGSFDAKNHCSGRIYEYICPTYVFAPVEDWPAVLAAATEAALASPPGEATEVPVEAVAPLDVNYRMPSEQLIRLREVLGGFVGTHNHFNFTIGKSPKDQSAKRYITDFDAADPEIYSFTDENGSKVECGEWISLKVKGQSFLLHQIRKMVGLAIMMLKTNTPRVPLQPMLLTSQSPKVNVPKAPALGLLLEKPLFDVYNKRAAEKGNGPVQFDEYAAEIDAFKHKYIYSATVQSEWETKSFASWFQSIMQYPHSFRYFTATGEIPADYSPGEHRPKSKAEEDEDNGASDDE
ncbi:pseudouridine synthase [Blastocladiella britannica]|nr:pseudouridine synthase [Blastocladiella britannica]